MKKFIIILIILVAIGVGVYYWVDHRTASPVEQSTTQNEPSNSATQSQVATSSNQPSMGQNNNQPTNGYTSPNNQESQTPDGGSIQVVEVDFDGTQFSPKTVNIKANDWVFFENKSNTGFWPASDPHPTHTNYPGFDALKTIAPGGEYKFQFTKAGTWGYHNHLDPNIKGTVVVSQ